ncbi:MAG: DUF4255 domain-containing protein [Mucilaginibacter sp.]|jgi:hypothetical protein
MIEVVFSTIINDCLSPYFDKKISPRPADGIWVLPCNVSEIGDPNSNIPVGKLTMSLVNIQEERTINHSLNYSQQKQSSNYIFKNPPVFLNLFILFASNSANTNNDNNNDTYYAGLQKISFLIQFFQFQNVFTPQNTPSLAGTGIEELIFDLTTLSFQDLNNLWGVLGSKYLPSVLYKVRLLCISENFDEGPVSIIDNIALNDIVIQQS